MQTQMLRLVTVALPFFVLICKVGHRPNVSRHYFVIVNWPTTPRRLSGSPTTAIVVGTSMRRITIRLCRQHQENQARIYLELSNVCRRKILAQ